MLNIAKGMCDGTPNFKGSSLMADAVVQTRATLKPTNVVIINAVS